ncbi:glutamine amidotransferase class-I family protein (macronuclear) [Tetrahymena thermophila SB210]|uniref:Glutamine amidotransferase class-I family protein n=1 Tax=Tetrahymena thermophila (strain SB210) TaxID=312017 RepID=I7LUW3_TETTS|nr:glutamine amidotransferase class-I family protein [Tetrahymena thermophila SB210]EAR96165.2 glutamine amidotransferase class-I family protein [Tetrahymena thermophila SB210]|eukprot:XP_001016410.2 glutamine amidotransferase class-I family protein [Tetrahymena thermophila SB210]
MSINQQKKYEQSQSVFLKSQNDFVETSLCVQSLNENKEKNDKILAPYLKLEFKQGLGQMEGENTHSLQAPSSLNSPNNNDIRNNTFMPYFDKSEVFDFQEREVNHHQQDQLEQQNYETQIQQTNQTLNVTEAFNLSSSKVGKEILHSNSIVENHKAFNLDKQITKKGLDNLSINTKVQYFSSQTSKYLKKTPNNRLNSQTQKQQLSPDCYQIGANNNLWGYVSPQQMKKSILQTKHKSLIWRKNWIRICFLVSKMRSFARQSAIFFRPNLLRKFQVNLIDDKSSNQQNSINKFQFANYYFGRQITYKKLKGFITFKTYIKFMKIAVKYCGCYFNCLLKIKKLLEKIMAKVFKHIPLFHNLSTLYIIWESFIFLCSSVLFIYLPFEYGFSLHRPQFLKNYIQIFTPAVFSVDIFIKANTKSSESGLISLLYLILQLLYFAHLFSCLWNAIGIEQSSYNQGWLLYYDKLNAPIYSRYLLSFYYSMVTMTTIGYGDITATSDLERFVMIFMTFISCGIFGYSINSFGNILLDFKKKRDVYLQELAKINQYFNQYNVDLVLQGRARKYIQYLYIDEKKNSACSIKSLSSLSEYMQNEIKRDVYVKRLQQVKVFNDILSEEVKQELVLKMKEHIYSPDQIIVDSKEVKEPQLYFVHSGLIQQFIQYDCNSQQKKIESFRENQYFGLLNFIIGNGHSDMNYKSVGISYVLQVSQSDFISVIKKDNVAFEKYSFLVDQIKFNKQYGIINQCCTSCFQRNHILKNCPFLFYEGKKEQIIRNYFKQINEQIKHYKRKQQKNPFNARVSHAYVKAQALLLVEQISDIQEEFSFTFSLQDNNNDQYAQADQYFDTSYHKNELEEELLEEQELKNINTGKLSDQEANQNKEKENAEAYKCSILDEELLMQEQKTFSDEQQQFSVFQHKKTKKTSFLENSEAHGSQVNMSSRQLSSHSDVDQPKSLTLTTNQASVQKQIVIFAQIQFIKQ